MVIDDERPAGGHGSQRDGRRFPRRRLPQIDDDVDGVDPVNELSQIGHVADMMNHAVQFRRGQHPSQFDARQRLAHQQIMGLGTSLSRIAERA